MSRRPSAMDVASPTVADVMITRPKTLPSSGTTVAHVREMFDDDHVHMVLLTDEGVLRGTLVRGDLEAARDSPDPAPAMLFATLRGRTIGPADRIDQVQREMVDEGLRRLAVVDDHGGLLGLLCLKRRRTGFCSDRDVAERAADRASGLSPPVRARRSGRRRGGPR